MANGKDTYSGISNKAWETFRSLTPFLMLLITLGVFALKGNYVTKEYLEKSQKEVTNEIKELRAELTEALKEIEGKFVRTDLHRIEIANLKEKLISFSDQNKVILNEIKERNRDEHNH